MKKQVYIYDNEGLLLKSEEEIKGKKLAKLQDVIDYFVEKGSTIEYKDKYVTVVEGKYHWVDGDYVKYG